VEDGQGRRLGARRSAGLGRGLGRMLALVHGVGYLGEERLKTAGVGQEGTGGVQFPQRDRRSGGGRCASPRTGSPPLGPGCMTGRKRQCRVGHGPTPEAPG
jgi:hypothetical protein